MTRTALVTGITGQDGPYLATHLLSQGYAVYGMIRGQSNPKLAGLSAELRDVRFIEGDLIDAGSVSRALADACPDEVYNLAAISSAPYSFRNPIATAEVTALGALRLLEAIRLAGADRVRFFQASTSEMFGAAEASPQNEAATFHPRNPYGVAKTFAHYATVNYRESFGMFAVSGIMFNHESPRRGLEFVTRKISRAAAAIKLGRESGVELGNLDARRDWGFAGDYVRAMHLMLQQDEPRDLVIGTGVSRSVGDFAAVAFAHVGLDWRDYVRTGEVHRRPVDIGNLVADSSRARRLLGWEPAVSFEQLVVDMVDHDLRLLDGLS